MVRLTARTALLLGVAVMKSASAQAPSITPPRLLEDRGVEYPARALRERFYEGVDVVLILEIDRTGNVASAHVETPRGRGFDEAALEAARQLRFTPAQRDGAAVTARIRFLYRFTPPAVTPVVPGPDPTLAIEPPSPPEPRPEAPAIEITVHGERRAPAVSSYTREEVRLIPGAFGDPFRAVETLPGVTPVASGLPFFYVRGSPPGNVGYFLDGVRVPYLYHIGFGPSVVQPALVARVDLHRGGYPAQFGRFTGGIVAAETTEPRSDPHGEGNLRLFDVGALAESDIGDGRGTVLLGGRYSYTAALVSLASPSVKLDYRDYQARITYDLTAKDRLSLFSFGAYDLLGLERNGLFEILFGTEFYRADLRYDRELPGGKLRSAATLGYDRTSASFIAGERRNIQTRSIGGRLELTAALGERLALRAGADVHVEEHRVERPRYTDPESPETRSFDQLFPPRSDRAIGAWLDLVLDIAPGAELVPGLRADLYGSGGADAVGVDPRLAARFTITRAVRLIHAFGLAHQAPSFALPLPGLSPANLQGGLQRSFQSSSGIEVVLDEDTNATATLFHNVFFDLSDALGTTTTPNDGPPDFSARADGRAFGGELYLKRRMTRRLGGFVSYTLSRSLRRQGGASFPSSVDRTHVANAALSYDLRRGWRAGGRVVFYTGAPLQGASSGVDRGPPPSHPQREAAFFRLDLRLEKRWSFGERFVTFVAEVMNATLNKETLAGEEFGPVVIPSLGVEVGF